MQDNKKTFYIEIGGVKESITNLESLEDILSKMEKQVSDINKNGGFTVANKESAKALKEQIELEKANQTIQENSQKSYREKQKVLTALGKVIKSMNADSKEEKQRQEELKEQYRSINAELKAFDATMGNHQREVGSYKEAIKAATQELKAMKGEMLGLDQHSEKFQELSKRAGELKDRIGDVNDAIKRQASDTRGLDSIIDYAKTATAAFELYKGAMSAFGLETEEAEKAMQQLIGAMSIVQSLQTLSETFQSTSASGKLLHGVLQSLGIESKTVAAETTAMATAEGTATVATKGLNVALKATKVALAALGIGIVIGLIAELTEHWEDLCNWVDNLIPGLKKTGGMMNTLIGVCKGLGKAVIAWLVNPFKTFANVMGKLLSGDFKGAWDAAVEGVKNQSKAMADAFKTGFQNQVEKGLEEISRKKAGQEAKDLEHHRNMITKEKNADGTYRKEYIEASKKMFDKKKQMYKKDSDEYRKVLEEEARFNQQVEDAKVQAAEKANCKKAAAAKKAADAAKKAAAEAAKEEEKRRKEEEERQKRIRANIDAYNDAIRKIEETLDNNELRRLNIDLKKYVDGPMKDYLSILYEIYQKEEDIIRKTTTNEVSKIWKDASEEVKKFFGDDVVKFVEKVYDNTVKDIDFSPLSDELESEAKKVAKQIESVVIAGEVKIEEAADNWLDKRISGVKRISDVATKELDKVYNKFNEDLKKVDVEPVRNKIFGFINKKDTLKKYEEAKKIWVTALEDYRKASLKWESEYEEYLANLAYHYGKDSKQYKEALEEKEEAMEKFIAKYREYLKRTEPETSLDNDYNGDNKQDVTQKQLWDKKKSLLENLSETFKTLDEMVLAPAMDTFAMYMDFAIEQTERKLEQVENLHDKAMDKVQDSADKIKELNDSLKDSSNTNIAVTKQQLAEEQLLYAQRLAEEQKLQQQETSLKNKAAKQEAQARKMELGYQMFVSIANTAQGATKALADWGWPTGPIFAGIMAALGAAQTAIIAKQIGAIKPVKYADGGIISGPSHAAGGVKVGTTGLEVEGGEAVINKRSTAKYRPLLDAINAAGNGGKHTLTDKRIRKFADGGQLNFERIDDTLKTSADTNRLINAIERIDFKPTVSVVDINKVNARLTKVKMLSGRG